MSTERPGLARVMAGSWLGMGALMVTRPKQSLAVVGQSAPPPALVVITRVLGARIALQNVVVLAAPTRTIVRGGAAVDVAHALSMVGTALRWPAYRRAALGSGALAATAAAVALRSVALRSTSRH
jgi:hypothetical protein